MRCDIACALCALKWLQRSETTMGCSASRAQQAAPPGFPALRGSVFFRTTESSRAQKDYEARAYQYATSSLPHGSLAPRAIVYPEDDDDIIAVIQYAKAQRIAVAVRSGGHNYSGYSSTKGPNLQIDMSGNETKQSRHEYPYASFDFDEASCTARIGVGVLMSEICKKSNELGVFFPHGECSHVRLGGHMQTGGYGLVTRPFGLMSDYVEAFDIITADGAKRTVRRGSEDAAERDLYFAVLGGSPGNFGVITHATLRCLRDRDYPNARGMKLMYPYDRDRLERLLRILADQSDTPNAPDFCVSVMVLGDEHLFNVFGDCDKEMHLHHPNLFGGHNREPHPVSGIAVTALWANHGGEGQQYDDSVMTCLKAAAGEPLLHGVGAGQFDDSKPRPLSAMMQDWCWFNVREFDLPYMKRLWVTDATDLGRRGYAKWAADRVEAIQGPDHKGNGLKIAAQFMPLNGRDTLFQSGNADRRNANPWRDSTSFCALDVFYDDTVKRGFGEVSPQQAAQEWIDRNDREGIGRADAKFCSGDRRLLWSPFGDANLDKNWSKYYQSEEDYQRVLTVKRKVDPDNVFTPNLFCVGASSAPQAA
jgi:hypothetical protein